MDNKKENTGEIIIYQTEDGLTKINLNLETVKEAVMLLKKNTKSKKR